MTLDVDRRLSDSRKRIITRALQTVLMGVVAFGAVTARWEMSLRAAIALGVTLLPAVLRREYGYSMAPGLVFWLTLSMILHTAGSVGLYVKFQWYDEVAHTASAMVIAGVGYAFFRALELHSDEIDVPSAFRAVFILVFVLAAGMLWEVLEFALGAAVPVYGVDDIVTDLTFNAVGAAIVATWGTDQLHGLIGFIRARFRLI